MGRHQPTCLSSWGLFLWAFLICLGVGFPQPVFAEAETSISEILEGFEETSAPEDGANGPSDSAVDIMDVLEGFEDDVADAPAPSVPPAPESRDMLAGIASLSPHLSIDGYTKISSTGNFAHDPPTYDRTDWRGLSRLRTELQLEATIDLPRKWQAYVSGKGFYDVAYLINGKDDYTDEVLDAYESEAEFREVYLRGTVFKNIDIKVGRQIVVWGKSDNIRVTDVLNPLDMREPGMTDIEDLRLPVAMTRLDYYSGPWNISGMAIHEIRFNKNPEFGSDFYPYPMEPPPERTPDSTLENTEYALAVNGIFSGWDFSAYYADFFNDEFRSEIVTGHAIPGLRLTHDRLQMVGATANIALGNWLLKGEIARLHGFEFARSPGRKYDRIDVLGGIEYSGFSETTISLEAVNRHFNEFNAILALSPDQAQEDTFQSAFRLTRTFVNDTITLTVLASLFGLTGDDGAFERYSVEYDVNDAVSVLFGVVTYQSGDLPEMTHIGKNDRILMEAKYSF